MYFLNLALPWVDLSAPFSAFFSIKSAPTQDTLIAQFEPGISRSRLVALVLCDVCKDFGCAVFASLLVWTRTLPGTHAGGLTIKVQAAMRPDGTLHIRAEWIFPIATEYLALRADDRMLLTSTEFMTMALSHLYGLR